MRSNAKPQDTHFTNNVRVLARAAQLIRHKIWLPKALYDSLPWFYLGSSVAAVIAILYINAWSWVAPHYFLFSAACLHLSAIIFYRRWPLNKKAAEPQPNL